MDKPLNEWKQDIIDDGIVDADEVGQMRARLYEDGVIDREEAEFLFAINDAVSGAANHPSWGEFFVQAIADHVLQDEESPNEIDAGEAAWLKAKIEGDGQYDDIEKALLSRIKREAQSIASPLKELIDSLNL
ncbi:MAG: TerB family tellurite resistance protein [Planctomycetota bacterium]